MNQSTLIILTIMFSLFGSKSKGQSLEFENPEVQKHLSEYLGTRQDNVYHSVIPFEMGYDAGGGADVFMYKERIKGVTYITGDLIGTKQKKSDAGNYELMVWHNPDDDWGRTVITSLAYYTIDASLNSSETMDIGPMSKGNIVAVIFDKYCDFTIENKKIGLLLVIGITKQELEWKKIHGGQELIKRLKDEKVYPYTTFDRKSIVQ